MWLSEAIGVSGVGTGSPSKAPPYTTTLPSALIAGESPIIGCPELVKAADVEVRFATSYTMTSHSTGAATILMPVKTTKRPSGVMSGAHPAPMPPRPVEMSLGLPALMLRRKTSGARPGGNWEVYTRVAGSGSNSVGARAVVQDSNAMYLPSALIDACIAPRSSD